MEDLARKVTDYLVSQRRSWAPACNYAYNAGFPCARALVYHRLNWQEKPLPSPTSLLIFREGDMHEKAVLQLLAEAGIEIIETQRPFEIPAIQLRGKIDGKIKLDRKYPAEIKSMNPHDFEKINSIEDMRNSTKVWIRGYVTQMMLYLLGMNEEQGLFILKNKVTGELKFIFCQLDYEYAEQEWKKLELVNEHVAKKTYPDRITDRTVCARCDFRHLCLADEESESLQVSDDPELVDLVEKREALKPAAKAFEEIDEVLKKRWKESEAGTYLLGGKFQVKISTYKRAFYNVPEDVKAPFKEEIETVRAVITPLK